MKSELKSPTRAGPFDTSKEDVVMAASKSLDKNVSIDMEKFNLLLTMRAGCVYLKSE